MRSDLMKKGLEKAPHRSLMKAVGLTDEEIARPLVGIANSWNEIVPGHTHLRDIVEAVKAGVRIAGGTPLEFGVIGVCDGLAMNHAGMKYSLASRELIADSIEVMAMAQPFDALVLVPNCDKIIPGMLMAALRLNIPAIVVSGGPMLAGRHGGKTVDLISVFEGVGAVKAKQDDRRRARRAGGLRLPDLRLLLGDVHRQLDELPDRGDRPGPPRQRHDPGGDRRAAPPGQARRDAGHGAAAPRTSARATS